MGKVSKKKAGGGAVLFDSRLILTFADVTRDDYDALRAAENRFSVKDLLAECMRVNVDEGFHALILMDFHLANYLLPGQQLECRENIDHPFNLQGCA